jgi:hypothetical protein
MDLEAMVQATTACKTAEEKERNAWVALGKLCELANAEAKTAAAPEPFTREIVGVYKRFIRYKKVKKAAAAPSAAAAVAAASVSAHSAAGSSSAAAAPAAPVAAAAAHSAAVNPPVV